jgi:hypothetical protein
MAKVYEIRELARVINSIADSTRRAETMALVRTVQEAERMAKVNCRNTFTGTRDRPKTGNLMNSIFSGYILSKSGDEIASGVVGVRSRKGRAGTRPYGRIHEYGGTITPKTTKNLWIPLFGPKSSGILGQYRDMTPSDFVQRMRERGGGSDRFAIIPGATGGKVAIVQRRGSGVRKSILALFALRKRVDMPERPYIRPAVSEAMKGHKGRVEAELLKADKEHS